MPPSDRNINHNDLTYEEVEEAFKSLKCNKAASCSNPDSIVRMKDFDEISYLIFMIFHSPFSGDISQVSPSFKTGHIEEVENYRRMSLLAVFWKILERIMYNRIYQYFKQLDVLYPKKFSFQVNN